MFLDLKHYEVMLKKLCGFQANMDYTCMCACVRACVRTILGPLHGAFLAGEA